MSNIKERKEILKDIVEFTEKERCLRITPKEKIAENGLCLRRQLKSKPVLTVLL